MRKRLRHLILGAGPGGLQAAKTIREIDKNAYITVVSKDRHVYSPALLHFFISGSRSLEEISFVPKDFFESYNIHWLPGLEAVELDDYLARVKLNNGRSLSYDRLLIATGSRSHYPRVLKKLKDLRGVYGLRNLHQARLMRQLIEGGQVKTAVIIGGGLNGIYVASELLRARIKVHIVEYGNNILPLQLDFRSARNYEKLLMQKGARVHTKVLPKEIIYSEDLVFRGLELSNGETILADICILTTGVKPNVSFLESSDLMINRGLVKIMGTRYKEGVLVNKYCQTNLENVYGAGDVCAEKISTWPLAIKQGLVAGSNMAGRPRELDSLYGLKLSMNFLGLKTVSFGDPNLEGPGYREELEISTGSYKRLVLKEDIIESAIFQGDIGHTGFYRELIENRVPLRLGGRNPFSLGYGDYFKLDQETGNFLLDF